MEIILFGAFIITSVCSLSAKHVYISFTTTWVRAQEHCRSHFTDLSPITSELEEEVFRHYSQGRSGWIGLYRDLNSSTGWTWSGGENANYVNWAAGPYWHSVYTYWTSNGWQSAYGYTYTNFFCFNLIVTEVKKTWEEALEHCRENHNNLTSLLSGTEHLLAQKAIQRDDITDQVWIGLRYLVDHWLWMNGDPLVYQAWPQGGLQDHQCPIWERCGALTKEGLWETWDCDDKLNFICY